MRRPALIALGLLATAAVALISLRALFPAAYSGLRWNLELASTALQREPARPDSGGFPGGVPRRVAHAGGAACGLTYANSREALDTAYARGFRHIELDFSWTSDGDLVLLHDWEFAKAFLGTDGKPLAAAAFRSLRMPCGMTPMALDGLADWSEAHPDAFIITDIKEDNLAGLALLARRHPSMVARVIP